MNKRKKAASIAFTGVTALGAAGLTPCHAHAAILTVPKVTVTPGGSYLASNVGIPTFSEGTQKLTCTHAFASGSLTGSPAGNRIGTVSSGPISYCTLDGFSFTFKLNKPETLYATSPTTGGITKGEVKGLSATLTGEAPLFSTCTAVFSGSLSGSYNNTTGEVTINPSGNKTLNTKSVTVGCHDVLSNNADNADMQAVYAVKMIATGTHPVISAS